MNIYQQRLLSEWRTHGKIIVASDFDSTISYWFTLENHDDIDYAIKVLKLCKEVGCYLTIFTACNPDRYDAIKQHCKRVGLPIDSINQTPIKLEYGNNGKVYANVFIDDRMLAFRESLEQLEEVAFMMRAEKHKVNEQTVDF